MKVLLLPLVVLLSLNSVYAGSESLFTTLLRQERSNKTFYQKVHLADLESNEAFDGKYFKIVKGKSNEAVAFNDKEEIVLKAATVYYHLTKAREFWLQNLKSEAPKALSKLIIRLEITNLYDELGHFANENRTPQFNNALSIPRGETPSWVPAEKQDRWENEIWFRPKKVISTKDMLKVQGANPVAQAMQILQGPIINYTQNRFTVSLMERLFYPSYARPFNQEVFRLIGTIAMTKAVVEASKHTDRFFMEKWFYLDTAMVPEVIYHEYAHVLLSDYLKLSHSTPVVEGMADYFAAVIANKRQVYGKIAGFSNAQSKDTQSKQPYSHWNEDNRNATADFVLSVLWDVRETLGEEIGDQVVYEARTMLNTDTASISNHLLRAILSACQRKCEMPLRDKLKLYRTFQSRGF